MIIACDVDDVVADLLTAWLRLYNADYADNLEKSQITEWDMTKFVKPECGEKIYRYLNQGIYDYYTDPIEGALEGIFALRGFGHRVVFVTSCTNDSAGAKLRWLRKYGFLENGVFRENDYVECHDKSLIRADFIIDDNAKTVETFPGTTTSLLYSQPHNLSSNHLRAVNWKEVVDYVSQISTYKSR